MFLTKDDVESLLAAAGAAAPQEGLHDDDERIVVVEDVLADPVAEDEYERVLARVELERVHDLMNAVTLGPAGRVKP